MNFKLFKLRIKIFYYSILGEINQNAPNINLDYKGHDSKRILIMFPFDEPSFRVAAFSFRGLGSKNSDQNHYTFLVKDSFKPLFHIRRGETVTLITDSKKPNKIKSDDSIIDVLKLSDFDLIIDLNTTFCLDASRILSLIPAKMKVGFKSHFSDLFYNIQLDLSKTKTAENGYQKVQLMLEN